MEYLDFKVTSEEMMKIMRDRHVSLVSTLPETGTLAELNVQVDDVVEFVSAGRNDIGYILPDIGEVVTVDSEKRVNGMSEEYDDSIFRIVSRANERTDLGVAIEEGLREYATTSPVITETVTRKRIVEGLYGKLSVGNAGGGWIQLALTDRAHDPANHVYVGHATLSRDDVIAARDHLSQLIDAMEPEQC